MRVLIGCECFGIVRDAFIARGHDAWSCDLKPTRRPGPHFQCDLRDVLGLGWDLGIFHPDCTYLTGSAEWAYADSNYDRYPGIGYHQKVKPGTLTGAARRQARKDAVDFVFQLRDSGIPRIGFENPTGHLSSAWRKPDQTIQPYEFGDDASKATSLWLVNLPKLVAAPANRKSGRMVIDPRTGKLVERWANQTDGGQNNLPPTKDRQELRSNTYQGIADAMADQWGRLDVRGAASRFDDLHSQRPQQMVDLIAPEVGRPGKVIIDLRAGDLSGNFNGETVGSPACGGNGLDDGLADVGDHSTPTTTISDAITTCVGAMGRSQTSRTSRRSPLASSTTKRASRSPGSISSANRTLSPTASIAVPFVDPKTISDISDTVQGESQGEFYNDLEARASA